MIDLIAGFLKFLLGLVVKKKPDPDPVKETVTFANTAGRASSDSARAATEENTKGVQDANQDTDDGVARVRNAGSLREQNAAVVDAIARANGDSGADGKL